MIPITRWDRYLAVGLVAAIVSLAGCSSPKQLATRTTKSPKAADAVRAVVNATLGATVKAPVATTKTGAIVLRERIHVLTFGNLPMPKLSSRRDEGLPARTGGEEFEALLDREKLPRRTMGSLRFYIDGASFFPAYSRAIEGARSRIDVQSYIFDNDDFAVGIADQLRAKSQRVPVRVYFDGAGSKRAAGIAPPGLPAGYVPPQDMRRYLTEGSNVKARRSLNPYFVADHTKLHLIDQTAFVGGMNIGREYRYQWHDMMALVEGPVVADLIAVYERHWRGDAWWRKFGGGNRSATRATTPTALDREPVSKAKSLPLRVLLTDTSNGRRDIRKTALLAIRCASRRVWIQTPYFSCDDVSKELLQALKRGVDVRIIIPGENDTPVMGEANIAGLKNLIAAGAKVYAYPGMTHLKATVCDDWAMFGSGNYDTLSMRLNREMNLATSDPRTVKTLATEVFERDFRSSSRVTNGRAKKRGNAGHEMLGDQL